jgi:diaminopimelate decarboxylase
VVHPEIQEFLDDTKRVYELVHGFGSPIQVVFPDRVLHNHRDFQSVGNEHKIALQVCYAHKANKSPSILRALASDHETRNGWVDVASVAELQSALCAGFRGDHIEQPGQKTEHFYNFVSNMGCLLIATASMSYIQ